MEDDLKKKKKELSDAHFDIELLNKRIVSFSKNTGDQTVKEEKKKL